jgi:Zn-dependent M28 family amino/carboxypeptidase
MDDRDEERLVLKPTTGKEDDEKVELPIIEYDGRLRFHFRHMMARSWFWSVAIVISLVVIGLVLVAILLAVGLSKGSSGDDEEPTLYSTIQSQNIQVHLQKLFETASIPNNTLNNGVPSRSVNNGYNASAEYIMSTLQTISDFCEITTQSFVVPVSLQLQNPQLSLVFVAGSPGVGPLQYQLGYDFLGLRYGGNGTFNFTAAVQKVKNYGCNQTDYDTFNNNGQVIALIENAGPCPIYNKAINAVNYGNAAGILFYNPSNRGGFAFSRVLDSNWQPGDQLVSIPCLTVSYSVGQTLISYGATETTSDQVFVNLFVSTQITIDPTFNVFCTTKAGREDDVLMLGAHLDSVAEGPGVNDNGSGSASILEIALQLSRLDIEPVNKVRFGWWGAEELGLLGSRYYVRELQKNETEYNRLILYLNFDMLGSPNYIPFIHNGSDAPAPVQNSSIVIQNTFEEFYQNVLKKPYALTGMGGGSDYYPFIYAGIAGGGLATGAAQIKTMDQRATWGGFANVQLDTCYHLPCDTTDNIDPVVLQDQARAAAYTAQKFMMQEDLRTFIYGPSN